MSNPVIRSAADITWLLLVLLTPLLVNLWGQQPFELPKVILLRTLVWLLAGLVLAETVLYRRPLWRELRTNPLLGPVGLLALVIGVTTTTAANWPLSLWGSYERGQGAITLLTYLLLFILAAVQLRPLARARQVIIAMAATAGPLLLFSLLQGIGWHPFGLISDGRSPIFATLGRANFLGGYLAILAPLTLGLLLTTPEKRRRGVWITLLVGELIVIGLTLARGAWLATAVSLALFALLWWGPRLSRLWHGLAWSGFGLLFFSGPFSVFWLGRGEAGSTAARLAIWQQSLTLIGRRPLLGYGADALGLIFPSVYPPELVYFQGRDFFVDRAHNLLLDWSVTAGLPGLLAFLLVLITFVIIVSRALTRSHSAEKRVLLIGVLAAVLGNVAHNLVSFDVTPTATATWLLMGMGIALSAAETVPFVTESTNRPVWRWALVGLLIIGLVTAIWQLNGRPLLADIAARTADLVGQAGDFEGATTAAERAVLLWPAEPAHHLLLSRAYWQRAAATPEDRQGWLAQAEAALLAALDRRPGDPALWLQTADFYTAAARQYGSDTRPRADEAYRQALALAPNHATIYTAWGRTFLEDGDPQRAAPLLRQAVMLDASSGEAYLYLGAAEMELGRVEVALADYREAIRLMPASAEAHTGLAVSHWELGQKEAALSAVTTALQLDPDNQPARLLLQEFK